MTIREALREGARALSEVSDEAELEAELLLRHVLSMDRACLYTRLNDPLAPPANRTFDVLLQRRLAHEPAAYIVGRKEFFGLELEVGHAALIPRPETESLVEAVIDFAREHLSGSLARVADVGTGSGAIAVALASSLPYANIMAIDPSSDALSLAVRNVQRHGLQERIQFVCADLLESTDGKFDVIAANLPYIPTSDWQQLSPEIRDYEPREALDGGADGLRVIARLLKQAPKHLTSCGARFAEIGDQQGRAAADTREVLISPSRD